MGIIIPGMFIPMFGVGALKFIGDIWCSAYGGTPGPPPSIGAASGVT